ncbi:hypothetical protein CH063_15529 [Colletotrichum higginsianum]|uniref:Uncharacterized protein n=2 Tax=Colletotrichum higginsianum TaxID=80884 RepID=H1W390_COLHI|nr:hypothetical protein CH63R_07449 [Colletotrichum higginsianum IMI 349063]OBR08684.1 hypothetical protein CH63R_07449 [Colletotrichum higginsianum IMI 349063]TIC95657.1 hypothetical protein CH35J_008641 [Colletotrichum higginsianum]CCF46953.1 hypothetical protein CH063_15529 [Colletotrichum higginsianum]
MFQNLLQRGQRALPLAQTSTTRQTPLPQITQNDTRTLSSTIFPPTRRLPAKSPALKLIQNRGLSYSAPSLARAIHPDTDSFIKYSLLQGPPRMAKVKIYKAKLAVRPPAMGREAVEHKMLGEVARHISAHSGGGSRPWTARHADWTAKLAGGMTTEPVAGNARTGTNERPKRKSPGSAGDPETPEPVRKTAAHCCALLAVLSAGALMGYLIRCWETGTKPSEGRWPTETEEAGMNDEGMSSEEMQKAHYLAAA